MSDYSHKIHIEEHFDGDLDWTVTEIGNGRVLSTPGNLRLAVGLSERYSNAQITDYTYAAMQFRWRPPVKMTVRAYFETPTPAGTAGFGFWNHPFSPDTRRLRLPQAVWFFFGSPPNNMQLARGVPGHGWKAATIDAGRPSALPLAPFAPLAVALMRLPALYQRLYPFIQRRLAISEKALDMTLLHAPHTYSLEWRKEGVHFSVDSATVLETPSSPRGACGFIAWLDNQYAIVTPQGRFGFGVVPVTTPQALVVERIEIDGG